ILTAHSGNYRGDVKLCFVGVDVWGIEGNFQAGFNYDKQVAAAAGVTLNFSYVDVVDPADCGDANIIVSSDDTVTGTTIAQADGISIGINPSYVASSRPDGFWQTVAAHEFGHSLGFTDVYDDCGGYTIMYGYIGNDSSLPSAPDCGDLQAWDLVMMPGESQDSENTYAPREDDTECWDVFLTTYYYYQDNNGTWHDGGQSDEYLGIYCGPPPD